MPVSQPPIAPSILWPVPEVQQTAQLVQGIARLEATIQTLRAELHQQTPAAATAAVPTEPIVSPNVVHFIAPGLEVELRMNENGDIYAHELQGPNAGKSTNLTEGKWQ